MELADFRCEGGCNSDGCKIFGFFFGWQCVSFWCKGVGARVWSLLILGAMGGCN